ncbi:glycine cleavage system aminomethyltransferase GcvT [Gordonia terrae]|uniref:Aminomethyltransferase n=2 Tax=Gordonia terrae TaxID=2055 RepID=A0AAD0K3G4_9ACTN|nr:glycine cleavage system aminomethyltransferase GcvT [Gordonia terrae]VTR08853.1 aminomethyltransferase GcvT [Clostridioides difficile]ANY21595.1 glycine cleavage system protein T [Gordonia terrae]AWO82323.1 glycine cleavage system aminomethyltransferase GcvT [Gordonia terrae]VTS17381.1 Aminomethyltransferase [Gordonia terrae]GAB44609.1 aminomethyltransferase [Gordonia terrae NBRC 100016]
MKATPLAAEHERLDAQMTDFAGWNMPLKYRGHTEEHNAVRTTAGLFDLSHMAEIAVRGPHAGAFLDHALVGEMSVVDNGRAKYSLLCAETGHVLDDLVVYRLAAEDFLVVANASNRETVVSELLSRAAAFDVSVTDQSDETALIALQGPRSAEILLPLVADARRESVHDLKYYAIVAADVSDVGVLVARTGYTGEDGFEIYVHSDHCAHVWRSLLKAGQALGAQPAGLAARDTLRLEAGMALYGHELDSSITPYEANLSRIVRLHKDFVGADALRKIAEEPPRRVLVGLVGAGRRAARSGYAITSRSDGRDIGVITSGSFSPTLGHPIAMGYVDSAFGEVGTTVDIGVRGTPHEFTVTALPFYKRSRR